MPPGLATFVPIQDIGSQDRSAENLWIILRSKKIVMKDYMLEDDLEVFDEA
jgi:hypothetical protein